MIDVLVDIVSRNGNMMLNFPLPNSSEVDHRELKILDEITRWTAVNGEGKYSTRPWKTFGDALATAAFGRGARFNQAFESDKFHLSLSGFVSGFSLSGTRSGNLLQFRG